MSLEDQAPVAPSAAVIKVLETYRDTGFGGRPLTPELLSRLQIGPSIVPRVFDTFEQFDLIDEAGRPTDDLIAFKQASSDSYRGVFAEILYRVYEPVFAVTSHDLTSASRVQIEDAFRNYRPESLRRRMVTLFIGLCTYAGILEEKPTTTPPARRGASNIPRSATNGRRSSPVTTRRGSKSTPTAPEGVVFAVSDEDIAALSPDEFNTVWAALGTLARARALAKNAAMPETEASAQGGESSSPVDPS